MLVETHSSFEPSPRVLFGIATHLGFVVAGHTAMLLERRGHIDLVDVEVAINDAAEIAETADNAQRSVVRERLLARNPKHRGAGHTRPTHREKLTPA